METVLGATLGGAAQIQEAIDQNAREPGFEVGAFLVTAKGAKGLNGGVLHQILSVVAVARQTISHGIGLVQNRLQFGLKFVLGRRGW